MGLAVLPVPRGLEVVVMQRCATICRPDWSSRVEALGLTYHTHEQGPYWDESAYYQFSGAEVDVLEGAGNELHELCMTAAQKVVEAGWWERLSIPEAAVSSLVKSWEREDFSLYGRFDLAYDGSGPPKLLEYNADTPTALVEASVVQWFWLREQFPMSDQFNSIHERLIEMWKGAGFGRVHFSAVRDHAEDEQTILYLQDTCHQAGLVTKRTAIEELGWHPIRKHFVDQDEQVVTHAFKLYPWEWMWAEEFGGYLEESGTCFVEPCWKMLLSNKGLLPILWELNPGHPNLLPCYEEPSNLGGSFVRKPKLSREGSNVAIYEGGEEIAAVGGDYGEEGFVYQARARVGDFGGNRPVMGVWIVGNEAAGLGIREDSGLITRDTSRFVPHLF